MNIATEFLQSAVKRSLSYKQLGDKTFEQLSDPGMHYQPNEESNSIAIIIQHVAGNMLSRWTDFLTTDGEKEWRDRDTEFEIKNSSKQELLLFWEKGWTCYLAALNNLREADLLKTIYIRKEPLTVVDAINRQLAHYPYHVGQVVYIGKMVRNTGWKNLSMPRNAGKN
ncbi:MAG: DUF1572 family protein [Ferruginibacter sp.]